MLHLAMRHTESLLDIVDSPDLDSIRDKCTDLSLSNLPSDKQTVASFSIQESSLLSSAEGAPTGKASSAASNVTLPHPKLDGLAISVPTLEICSSEPTASEFSKQLHKHSSRFLRYLIGRLHIAICRDASIYEIESILLHDEGAVSRSVPIKAEKMVYHPVRRCLIKKTIKATYTYPLHLALRRLASSKIIELLIDTDPSMLLVKDGPQQDTPLHVLLKSSPSNVALVDLMLLEVPFCVSVKDLEDNTPLHIACSHGASMDVIKHLCILYPEAVSMRNAKSQTPLDISQRLLDTTVYDMLLETASGKNEH
jgi:Ankyrin repeats (many copies)